MDTAWAAAEQRLREELGGLEDGELLVLGEPVGPAGPPRGLLRRRATPPPTRYVQFRRAGGWVYAECVGSRLFGGDWATTAEQHEALRALGWLAPGDDDPSGTQPSYPNYWRTVPAGERLGLAVPAVAALRVLGADPGSLESRRERA